MSATTWKKYAFHHTIVQSHGRDCISAARDVDKSTDLLSAIYWRRWSVGLQPDAGIEARIVKRRRPTAACDCWPRNSRQEAASYTTQSGSTLTNRMPVYRVAHKTVSTTELAITRIKTRQWDLERFYFSVIKQYNSIMSCLPYLLLDMRDPSVTDRLRHPRNFETLKSRTSKFQNVLIPYSLTHFF